MPILTIAFSSKVDLECLRIFHGQEAAKTDAEEVWVG